LKVYVNNINDRCSRAIRIVSGYSPTLAIGAFFWVAWKMSLVLTPGAQFQR